jgi:hypothetical protein
MRQGIIRLVLAAAVAVPLVLVTGAPVGAGGGCSGNASNAPDGKIGVVGIPGTDGAGTYALSFASAGPLDQNGETVAFRLKWKNVSPVTQKIRVNVRSVEVPASIQFAFQFGDILIPAVVGQKLGFPDVPPQGSVKLRYVAIHSGTTPEFALSDVRGRYGGQPAMNCDALRVIINAT